MKTYLSNKYLNTTFYFVLCAVIIFLIHWVSKVDIYPYDAGAYWNLGYQFGVENFSFSNYSQALRGYLYPFLHYILIKLASLGIGSEQINLWIFHSLFYSFAFIILLPALIEKLFDIKINFKARGIFALVSVYILKGMILYPISDLPALIFLLISLWIFVILVNEKNNYSFDIKGIQAILAGFFLGGAYYIRPVYLGAIIGFLIVGSYFIIFKKKYMIFFMLIGILLVAIPQIIINAAHFNTYSPLILTEEAYEGQSLYLKQLTWGISMQKYETNMDLEVYNNAQMIFSDNIGKTILLENEITSYADYIKFVMIHFADMICIYLKHLFNGMDITYNNVYIYNLYSNRFIIQTMNYTLIFWGVQGMALYFHKKWRDINIGIILIYLLPILLVIPTAVETRFFVGLHLVLYLLGCTILLNLNWRKSICEKKLRKLAQYFIFLLICFLLNSQAFNYFGIPLW